MLFHPESPMINSKRPTRYIVKPWSREPAPSHPEIPPNFFERFIIERDRGKSFRNKGGSKQIQISNNKCCMIHASFWKKTSTFNATDIQRKNREGVGWGLPDDTSPKTNG